ncbi:MAG: 4-hydroxy-tetrahydrodipicolinate reductase [Dehalococcoidia bacterium]
MDFVRVVVNGALGRMGQEIAKAVVLEPGMKAVGAVEREVAQQYLPLAGTMELVPFSSDLGTLLKECNADVVVDFTDAEASIAAARTAIRQKVSMVIGTAGLSEDDLREIEQLCKDNGVGAVVAADFSLGAALMVHLSRYASRFFDHAEIVEMHHDKKADAPSETAIATAGAMLEGHGKRFGCPESKQEKVSNSRGVMIDGIAVHSVRLPGFLAGQEVIFSGAGETLSLHHNAMSRECYLRGVLLAIKKVKRRKGLTCGLDALLDLE